ncbi:MAG TPA: hypothetical protein VKB84_16195 [Candidatus Binataceae bacterium]|nr:hypothetical protein [Candidatus Binataceae bacterium]
MHSASLRQMALKMLRQIILKVTLKPDTPAFRAAWIRDHPMGSYRAAQRPY